MYSHDIILTDREMQGCFCINYNQRRGSTFIFWTGERSIFVTAAHQLRGAVVGDSVLLLSNGDWVPHKITYILFHGVDDVVIYTLEMFFTSGRVPLLYPASAIYPGGKVLFIGFPHGLSGNYPGQGWPTPLVRSVAFSGVIDENGQSRLLLDGFNNPGYSGGPIYGVDLQGNTALVGVVSGYRYESVAHSRLYRRDEDGNEIEIPDLYVKPNSGMIYGVPTRSVLELCAASGEATNPHVAEPG